MSEYKVFEKKRRLKQFFMSSLFLGILIGGWRWAFLGYFVVLCMICGIGIGLFKGRKWCNWFCPRGSLFDALIKPISPKKQIPHIFRSLPLRVGMLSFLMLIMALQIIKYRSNPYKIGMFFIILLTLTTALGIILALIFHHRSWCCFCPIGSIANWVGRNKYLLKIDSKLCIDCKLCYKVCPIQVAPFNFKSQGIQPVKDGDCLKCNLCALSCPKKALGF